MIRILFVLSLFVLASCGPSAEEKINIAAIACSIMGETRNMDAAVRVEKMNDVRVKIGGEPFLGGDSTIQEAFEYGLCLELVLNEKYDETLQPLKDALEIIKAEKQLIADSKPSVETVNYSNGKTYSRTNYQPKVDGGKKHGLDVRYHRNGRIKSSKNYIDGKEDGPWKQYNENGQLEDVINYKDGKWDGFRKYFYEGKVDFVKCYKNGKETDMSYC
tara:strand:+ start:1336 stop:1986 length:651 start_codon:yes stop_codon:yes gene_type:complete